MIAISICHSPWIPKVILASEEKQARQLHTMKSVIRFLAIFAICVCGSLQCRSETRTLSFPGPCPNVSVVPDFDVSAYMGLWHEAAKYPAPFEEGGKCVTATYDLKENGVVRVRNAQFNTIVQKPIEIEGTAIAVDNAKLLVQFPGQPTPKGSNYWVLGTDYTNYSVVFSCSAASTDSHSEIVWILTRERVPSVDTVLKAVRVLVKNNLSLSHLTATDQSECA